MNILTVNALFACMITAAVFLTISTRTGLPIGSASWWAWCTGLSAGLIVMFAATHYVRRRQESVTLLRNGCPGCRYDLEARPFGPCPECGWFLMSRIKRPRKRGRLSGWWAALSAVR